MCVIFFSRVCIFFHVCVYFFSRVCIFFFTCVYFFHVCVFIFVDRQVASSVIFDQLCTSLDRFPVITIVNIYTMKIKTINLHLISDCQYPDVFSILIQIMVLPDDHVLFRGKRVLWSVITPPWYSIICHPEQFSEFENHGKMTLMILKWECFFCEKW